MKYNKAIILLCVFLFFAFSMVAQQPDEKAKNITVPISIQQAKNLLDQACELEKEKKYEDALSRYCALLEFIVNQTKKSKQYSQIIHVKLNSDLNPAQLLVPDAIEFAVQIRKKGYFSINKVKSVLPEMEYCAINEKLVTIPRQVNIEIKEDFYRQGTINPDEVSLIWIENDNPVGQPIQITQNKKFKPGRYQLSITRQGYDPIMDSVVIYPDENPFLIQREMRSKPRKIQYKVQGDFIPWGTEQITPDEISVNGQSILQGGSVKPGQYELIIQKDGYEPIVKKLMIEPEERPFYIAEYMRSCPRELQFRITGGDDKVPFQPDEITLNGKSVKHGDKVKPGTYRLTITKRGCNDITERLVIEPKNAPFVVERTISLPPRRIETRITALFPKGLRLTPDVCTLNSMDALGHSFAPGGYTVEIKRSGYKTIRKQIQIIPDDSPYVINEVMEPNPRHLDLEVSQEMPHENPYMQPQATVINEKTLKTIAWKEGISVSPESYILKIEMNGFEADISRHLIMPLDEPYKIARNLVASPRTLIIKIVAEYPPDKIIVPDEMTMDNKTITKDFKVKPGMHDLTILKEGYIPIRKSIKIGANSSDYIITERLQTQNRIVHVKFSDSKGKEILPDEITLGDHRYMPDTPLLLKPGIYAFKANLKGYAPFMENILIPMGTETFTIERLMINADSAKLPASVSMEKTDIVSRPRTIKVNLVYDGNPSEGLKNRCIVSLTEPKTKIACYVADGVKVKPGLYFIAIDMPHYIFDAPKNIEILPDDQPYEIDYKLVRGNEKPITKGRHLLFNVQTADNTLVWPLQVLVNGQSCSLNDTFASSSELDLVVRFKEYKTVHKHVKVLSGEGKFIVDIPLQPLKKYAFILPENTTSSGNINYELYADGEKIEDHLVEIEKGTGLLYYKVWVGSNAKVLQVYAGTEFAQRQFDSLSAGIMVLNSISIPRLIEHLENQSKGERGHREALEILENITKKPDALTMLRQCTVIEIGQLMQYIAGWEDLKNTEEYARIKIVMEAIGGLKK